MTEIIKTGTVHHICRVYSDGSQSEYTIECTGKEIHFRQGENWIDFPVTMLDVVIDAMGSLASPDVPPVKGSDDG